jgi:hypothetical protein
MKLLATTAVLIGCFSMTISSQAQRSLPQETLFAFTSSSKAQILQLAKRFEVKDDSNGYICQDDLAAPESLELFRGADERVETVKLTSRGCRASFLLTYWYEKGRWLYGGTIRLDEWYGDVPHVTARKLLSDQPPVVVVDDNLVDRGTGISQKNTQIYMLVEGKMRTIFNQPLHSHFQVPYHNGDESPYLQDQDSEFKIATMAKQDPREMLVEETRISTVNGRKITQHFGWVWEPRLKMLLMISHSPN